jgi:hypothetical protein
MINSQFVGVRTVNCGRRSRETQPIPKYFISPELEQNAALLKQIIHCYQQYLSATHTNYELHELSVSYKVFLLAYLKILW